MKDHPNYRPIDPRHRIIGRHSNFDSHEQWTFVRVHNPRLYRKDFRRDWTVDRVVFVIMAVLLALGLLAVNLPAA
jgi:hypothetical protein